MTLRLVDHLSFGSRVEKISVLLDGASAFETDTSGFGGQIEHLPIEPGIHRLTLVASVSEPCGLLAEPRASVSVRTETTFSMGKEPATLEADLYAREATSDPLRSLAVRFTGKEVVLGIPEEALRTPDGCGKDDALCVLETGATRARARGDAVGATCFTSKVTEARALRETLEDSYTAVQREGSTTRDAESAQLRARYAEARLRSLPEEAEICALPRARTTSLGAVQRRVEQACPNLEVTAGLDRY